MPRSNISSYRLEMDKITLFKRPKNPVVQAFNVNSDESITESDCDTTVACVKPLFKPSNIQSNDVFQVSFNETVKNISHSDTINKKSEDTQNYNKGIDSDSTELSTFIDKPNPFKKVYENNENNIKKSHDALHVSYMEEEELEKSTGNIRDILEKTDKSIKNFSLDNSLLKSKYQSHNSDINFNQSSFNDENLNHWMSDHSDEEVSSSNAFETPTSNSQVPLPSELHNTFVEKIALPTVPPITSSDGECTSLLNVASSNSSKEIISTKELPFERQVETPTSSDNNVAKNPLNMKEKPKETEVIEQANKSFENLNWEEKFKKIVSNSKKVVEVNEVKTAKKSTYPRKLFKNIEKNLLVENTNYRPPKLIKPAQFATKKLYQYIINKLESKFGIDTLIEAERLVLSICETVKKVNRRKGHQKKLIQDLKKEMAKAGLVETTVDFYEFVIKFLPYSFRVRVIPCVQPVTNAVFPPKEVRNPFEKIL